MPFAHFLDLLKSCLSLLSNRKRVTFYGSLYALYPTEILQGTVRESVASNYRVYDEGKNSGCPKYGVRETCARLHLPQTTILSRKTTHLSFNCENNIISVTLINIS